MCMEHEFYLSILQIWIALRTLATWSSKLIREYVCIIVQKPDTKKIIVPTPTVVGREELYT